MRRHLLLLAILFAWLDGTSGAETKATLKLSESLLWSGERVIAYVRVQNWDNTLSPPKLESSGKGITIRGPGSPSQETKIINGQIDSWVSFPFAVDAQEDAEGTVTVGPAIIQRRGGTPLSTNTVQLEVHRKPPPGIHMKCELYADKGPTRWPFRVVYRIYYSGELSREVRRGFFPRPRPFGISRLTLPILQTSNTKAFPFAVESNLRPRGVSLANGEEFIVQEGFGKLNGYGYKTLIMGFDVLPMKAGAIRIEPAHVELAIVTGSGRYARERQFTARSPARVYTAYAPPSADRPATHGGAVGTFSVDAAADRQEVDAFDPIKLTVTVTPRWPWSPEISNALLEALQPPLWTQDPALTQGFDVLEVDSGRVVEGKKVFVQTVRALNETVTSIPPLPFPFYNPATKKYEVARAAAIPLKVRAVKTVTGKDAMRVARPDAPTVTAPTVAAPTMIEQSGIGANFTAMGTVQVALDPRAQLLSPSFLSTIVIPPIAFLGLLVWRQRRRRDPIRVRQSQAQRNTRRRLMEGGLSAAETSACFQSYFRDRLALGAGELTPDELDRVLGEREVPADVRQRVHEFLEECLAASFGGGESGTALAKQAVTLVDLVEKELPNR